MTGGIQPRFEVYMAFQVGDQVIHWIYGPGIIIQMDEKELSGNIREYYVVQMRDLMLWVPTDTTDKHSLRFPTSINEFQKLFRIIASSGQSLPDDRFMRKTHLEELLGDGTLESVCRVVRDLAYRKRTKKMNDNDNSLLERARNFLVSEWSIALSIPVKQAEQELMRLLGEDKGSPKK